MTGKINRLALLRICLIIIFYYILFFVIFFKINRIFFLTFIKKLSYDVFVAKSVLFKRYYHNDTFIEVLVLNPYSNEGNEHCLGVDAYYAYDSPRGLAPMTDEQVYLSERPEHIIPLLNRTTTFTDASRWRSLLAFP